MGIRHDGPFLVIEREQFVVRFPDHGSPDLELIEDQDFYVTVTGGVTHSITLMTLGAIGAAMERWAATGEAASGSYFWTTDLVTAPQPGITAMIRAIEGLVANDELGQAGRVIPPADGVPADQRG